MSTKKRNKKHNPDKRAQRFFSNTRLWSWETMRDSKGQRLSHGEARCGFVWKPLSQREVDNLITRNNNWAVCCRALCHVNGSTWIESEIRSARDIKVNDFADLYDDLRNAVLSQVRLSHVVDVGWIVQSFGKFDRTDSNFELVYQGEITQERAERWAEQNKTYRQEAKAA